MVSPEKMRWFAAECQLSAEETADPRRRDLLMSLAKRWMATAAGVERQMGGGPP
jgi:hypothetical protein